jgi:hypothetical protein
LTTYFLLIKALFDKKKIQFEERKCKNKGFKDSIKFYWKIEFIKSLIARKINF